jgi:hypothetical protein
VVANGTAPNVSRAQRNVAWDPVAGRFYAIDSYGATTDVDTYDAGTNTWSTVHTVGGPRVVSAAAVVWDTFAHRLLVFGGCYGSDICSLANAFWSYDPASQSWQLLAPNGPVPPALDGQVAVWDPNDHALLLTGASTDTWSWDSLTHVWTKLSLTNAHGGALPVRYWPSAVWDPVDRELLVFGGARFDTGHGFTPLDELWALHPDTRSWAQLPQADPHPPANAFNEYTFVDAATWDPTASAMRLLTPDPASSTPATALWSYAPLPPLAGGTSFALRTSATSATLSWQTGDSQSGYHVVRRIGSSTLVGPLLPAAATSATDAAPGPAPACYQLATMGGTAVVAASALLCGTSGRTPSPGDPQDLSISVDPTNRVSLRWDPPASPGPSFTGYTVLRADIVSVTLVGTTTHFTSDPITTPTCWFVRAYRGSTMAGQTPLICAAPGFSSR